MTTRTTLRLVLGAVLGVALPLALTACAVKLNGTSYGPGTAAASPGGGTTAPPAAGSAANPTPPTEAGDAGEPDDPFADGTPLYGPPPTRCFQHKDPPRPLYSTTPVDPWLAVASDKPALATGLWRHGKRGARCTAQHDHCVRECAWFISYDKSGADQPVPTWMMQQDEADTFRDGMRTTRLEHLPRPAYRTVPATRRHLTPGAIVIALTYPARIPKDDLGVDAWLVGRLDRVDWKAGKLYMVGSPDPFWLSATRVAVLSYRPGGKVEIVGKLRRDELAARPGELFEPLADVVTVSDPWAQVGKDKQPLAADDRRAFETAQVDCVASNDHCLRPWVWLADVGGGKLRPARFDGKAFLGLDAIDRTYPLPDLRVAYRTAPATRERLEVGATVFVHDLGGRPSEQAAHTTRWRAVKVTEIGGDGMFRGTDASGGGKWKVEHARVPVVMWVPGEKAEAYQ